MKQRFSALDLRAAINEINNSLSGSFIQNFYSLDQRFLFIKTSNKKVLLIEPGIRMNLINSIDEGNKEISHFCKKLRENCRHARIQKITQNSFDRVAVILTGRFKIAIEFFSGRECYHFK